VTSDALRVCSSCNKADATHAASRAHGLRLLPNDRSGKRNSVFVPPLFTLPLLLLLARYGAKGANWSGKRAIRLLLVLPLVLLLLLLLLLLSSAYRRAIGGGAFDCSAPEAEPPPRLAEVPPPAPLLPLPLLLLLLLLLPLPEEEEVCGASGAKRCDPQGSNT